MMRHIALALFTIFASIFLSFASPLPSNVTDVELEKRLTHTGRGTWYYPGLGNCGKMNTENDLVVAIGKGLYDRNGGSNCDQYVQVTNTRNGKKAYGLTRDSCPGCSDNDLDMSPALFKRLDSLDKGVISISWNFKAKGWRP